MREVRIGGLTIAYERAGEGPPVVLLHGILGDSRGWSRQLDRLSDDFTVVAWDAPGCGRSSDPPDSFRMPEYADCLAELIDALVGERVTGPAPGVVVRGSRPAPPRGTACGPAASPPGRSG